MPSRHALESLNREYARLAFGVKSRQRIYSKVSKRMQNGVPIVQALEDIHSRYVRDRRTSEPDAIALSEWLRGLKNGRSLSESCGGWVPHTERMLLAAGEQGGKLPEAMDAAMEIAKASRSIKASVVKGLAYPAFLILLSFVFVYLFGVMIVPKFSAAVQGKEVWTGVARAMVGFSEFIQQWYLVLAVGVIGLIVAFVISLPVWTGRYRAAADRAPPYSIYRVVVGGTWLITLAALVEAGVRIEDAVTKTAAGASGWLRERVEGALRGLKQGFNLGEALARTGLNFPDREIIDDLAIYAQMNGFEVALATVGREWIEEAVEIIDARMKLVFAVCLVVVALLIGFMIVGFIDMQVQFSQAMKLQLR